MKHFLLIATSIAISAAAFAGERSDLERADLARIEFGDVSGSIRVFEVRNDHFRILFDQSVVYAGAPSW